MFKTIIGRSILLRILATVACKQALITNKVVATGGWPRPRTFPATPRVPPVPRIWGPGISMSFRAYHRLLVPNPSPRLSRRTEGIRKSSPRLARNVDKVQLDTLLLVQNGPNYVDHEET